MNEFDKAKFEIMLKMTKQNKPLMDDYIEYQSGQLWVAFQQLRKKGFTDSQAIDIIKERGDLTSQR